MSINYDILPEHCRKGMQLYIERGIVPGDFLQAVLKNDLVHSFSKADTINKNRLEDYARFLYSQAPFPCWGTNKKIIEWCAKGGLCGIKQSQNNLE